MRLIPEVVVPRIAKPKYSCVFCPHPSTAGLLPIHEPSEKIRSLVKDPNAKPMAHIACARCIPELSIGTIDEDQTEDQAHVRKRAVVMGTEDVAKERWSLVSPVDRSFFSEANGTCILEMLYMHRLQQGENGSQNSMCQSERVSYDQGRML